MRQFDTIHSNHKRIASSALLIGVLTLIAKLFVAAREIAIAWRYGVSEAVDCYQLALTIVTWIPMLMISVMTVVVVPRLVAARQRSENQRGFIDELNGTALVAGIGLLLLTWTLAPLGARILGSGLQPATIGLTTRMCRLMSPVACFALWTGYLCARLQARERFAYTVTEAIPALAISTAVFAPFVLGPLPRLGWATSVGYAAQVVALGLMVRRADQPLGKISLRHGAQEWPSVYRDLGVMALGQVVITISLPIDQAFAASIGTGDVATFGYANRIVVLVTGLGAVVFARALLPSFSTEIAEGYAQSAARHARQWSLALMFVGAVLAAIAWLLARWGVALVFQRGAFTTFDVDHVSQVLRIGMLQVPFVFGSLALVQFIAASGRYSVLVWVACGALPIKILLNAVLIRQLGLIGLMWGTVAMYTFSFACQYAFSRRQ